MHLCATINTLGRRFLFTVYKDQLRPSCEHAGARDTSILRSSATQYYLTGTTLVFRSVDRGAQGPDFGQDAAPKHKVSAGSEEVRQHCETGESPLQIEPQCCGRRTVNLGRLHIESAGKFGGKTNAHLRDSVRIELLPG